MSFSDIFKSSFLENVTSVSLLDMALALVLAFGVGLFIFFIYKKTYAGVMYSSSFGVTLAKANTTLDATAAGVATVANGDVTYSVTGVTLDKVTVNQVTATADTVPDGWTVAKDASGKTALTIDTENMQLPTGSANKEHAILTISNDSFAGATVTGRYAYASHSPFTKANGGVTVAGEKKAA